MEPILLTLLFACIEIDRYSFGQFGISQPLIGCTLAGAMVGNWEIGLLCGAAIQLLWIGFIPAGASMYTNESVAAAAFAAFSATQVSIDATGLMIGFLLIFPLTFMALLLDTLGRNANGFFAGAAKYHITQGNHGVASRFHLAGIAINGLNGILIGWVGLIGLTLVFPYVNRLVHHFQFSTGLALQWYLLPVIGILFLAHDNFQNRRSLYYSIAGIICGFVIVWGDWL